MGRGRTAIICGIVAAAVGAAGVAAGRELGAREAREEIARLVGARSPDAVRIRSITPGPIGDQAIVVAQVELAFRMAERDGEWRAAEVRLGENRWEDIEMLRRALDAEKARVAGDDLKALAAGVEAYRRERGFYPEVETSAALVDHITPRFLPRVLREDPWDRPFSYSASPSGFRLGSAGPDGEPGTGDDILVTGGPGGA
jgi:hypothetical protein